VTTTTGKPIHITITEGQRHDISQVESLLPHTRGKYCIADSAYDSRAVREAIAARRMTAVIPGNRRTGYSKVHGFNKKIFRLRGQIECFFFRLKRFRAVATRYEKSSRNFLALVHIACAYLSLVN
jgi:transposase